MFSGWLTRPQSDGHDTLAALLSTKICGRTLPPDVQPGEPTLFDGSVALRWREDVTAAHNLRPAPLDHPNLTEAVRLLACWPEARAQFAALIKEFSPYYLPGKTVCGPLGSMSHQPPDTLGSAWATVNDEICLAQAMVHEFAHNKLFALGQDVERGLPLFENSDDERFDSPVRLDIPRPIAAVFHGLYAFLHVLSLDRRLLESQALTESQRAYVMELLSKNARRVRRGLEVLQKCAHPAPGASEFIREFYAWAEEELQLASRFPGMRITSARSIWIVGPSGAGKSTFSQALAACLGWPVLHLDNMSLLYAYNHRLTQAILHNAWGASKLYLMNRMLDAPKKREVFVSLVAQGHLSTQVRERVKADFLAEALRLGEGRIVDTGAGHVVFEDQKHRADLKKGLTDRGACVVHVNPIMPIEEAVDMLTRRNRARGSTERAKIIRARMENPSYRTLTDYCVDTRAIETAEKLENTVRQIVAI